MPLAHAAVAARGRPFTGRDVAQVEPSDDYDEMHLDTPGSECHNES